MSRVITPKQRKFADRYMETGNGSLAVKEIYDVTTDASARAIASQNLAKPLIMEYIQGHAEMAVAEVVRIAKHGESDEVRLRASKDILDRAGFKPVEKTSNVNINIEAEVSGVIKDLAEELNELHRTRDIRRNGIETSVVDSQASDKK